MSEAPRFDATGTSEAWDLGAEAWGEFVESGADYYFFLLHSKWTIMVNNDR